MTSSGQLIKKTFLFLGIILFISGCAHKTTSPPVVVNPDRDPLEGFNRVLFSFNTGFDTLIGKPTAGLYRGVFPVFVRNRVRDFFQNLREPNNFANALLKGDMKSAGRTLGRFLMNSTIGLAGLIDLGDHMNMPYQRHDFGMTLAAWGVQNGPYLMLPFRGPSNFRDALGRGVDFFMDPLNLTLMIDDKAEWILARDIPEGIDDRSRMMESIDELKRGSLDFYATVRSAYFQNREAWASKDGHVTTAKQSSSQTYDELWSEDKKERKKEKSLKQQLNSSSLPTVNHTEPNNSFPENQSKQKRPDPIKRHIKYNSK